MFACLIIFSELAILYTVFWYIFLRETKPYRISGNPWGCYEGQEEYGNGTKLMTRSGVDLSHPSSNPDWVKLEQIRLEQMLDLEEGVNKTRPLEEATPDQHSELPRINRNPALSNTVGPPRRRSGRCPRFPDCFLNSAKP